MKPPRADKSSRFDRYGELRFVAATAGYVIFRRPRATAYVMTEKEWDALPRDMANSVKLEVR